jgi:isopentenyl phosphate kinase
LQYPVKAILEFVVEVLAAKTEPLKNTNEPRSTTRTDNAMKVLSSRVDQEMARRGCFFCITENPFS